MTKKIKFIVLYQLFLIPLYFLLIKLFIFEVNDPIKYIYTVTGISSTVILFFSISISLIKNKINLLKYRKHIGLLGFFYALLHLINFAVLDTHLDIALILKQTFEKPFVYLGMIAFFILLFMALTSTKKLFKKFMKYHRLVYLALFLISIHFTMAQKIVYIEFYVYIFIILAISYFKLIQLIIKNNKI